MLDSGSCPLARKGAPLDKHADCSEDGLHRLLRQHELDNVAVQLLNHRVDGRTRQTSHCYQIHCELHRCRVRKLVQGERLSRSLDIGESWALCKPRWPRKALHLWPLKLLHLATGI